ncbi:MAG: rod shape-determining protein MreD [Bacteroidota bacterium]
MRQNAIDASLTLLFLLLQTTLARYLAVGGLPPDLTLIWIVYLAVRRGQIAATLAGFASGLVLDLMSGHDGMLGLAALCKTAAGFLAGYFYNENKTLQTLSTYRFLLILAFVAIVHNLLYFTIFLQGSEISWWGAAAFYGVPSAAYTAAMGLLPMFVFARRFLS